MYGTRETKVGGGLAEPLRGRLGLFMLLLPFRCCDWYGLKVNALLVPEDDEAPIELFGTKVAELIGFADH